MLYFRRTVSKLQFRVPGALLALRDAAPRVYGVPPNLLHDTDVYDSLIPYVARQNLAGCYFSLRGQEYDGVSTVVPVEHNHDTEETLLKWVPAANWSFSGSQLGSGSRTPGAKLLSSDSVDRWALNSVQLQEGQDELWFRVRVSHVVAGTVALWADCVGDAPGGPSPDFSVLIWCDNPVADSPRWYNVGPIDVISLLSLNSPDVRSLNVLWRRTFGTSTQVVVHQAQLAWKAGY